MGLCLYVDLCFHASSLPCSHTFWHAIPTYFTVFIFTSRFISQLHHFISCTSLADMAEGGHPEESFDSGMFQSKFIHCCITSIYAYTSYSKTLDSCHMDFFIGMKMEISCRHGLGGGLIGYWYGMCAPHILLHV